MYYMIALYIVAAVLVLYCFYVAVFKKEKQRPPFVRPTYLMEFTQTNPRYQRKRSAKDGN